MGKVSIIVPVYNKEPYLGRCIESVLRQSYSDFELILVNDGSTDGSGEICERYKKTDPRITVIHQENRGVSLARNMGIHHACTVGDTEWISFLDADDALHPRFLEIMLRETVSESNTIVACRLQKIEPGKLPKEIEQFPVKEVDINTIYGTNGRGMGGFSACGKLFPKEMFIRVRFPSGLRNEDMYTCPVLMKEANRIVFIDAGLYDYYMIPDSYVHTDWKPLKLEEIYAAEFAARFFKNMGADGAHIGTLSRLLWIIRRQRLDIRKSAAKHKFHFLLFLYEKEFEMRRRIRHAKK